MGSACFSHPEVLRAVSLKWLTRLLEPQAGYLESRGLALPGPDADWSDLDGGKLLSILMTPDPEVPRDLIDSLYYLHEMATPEAMDRLLDEAEAQGISIDNEPEPTPHDIAIQMWLRDSHLVKHHHAERTVGNPYMFVYFHGEVERSTGLGYPTTGSYRLLKATLWSGSTKENVVHTRWSSSIPAATACGLS